MRLDARSGWLALAVGVVAGWVAAAPPVWWTTRGVLTTNAPNDFAPATAGQLKHIASKAKDELDHSLPNGAGTAVAATVASFLNTNNCAAVNLGQIKYVAQPFYVQLILANAATGYPWTVTSTDDMNFAAANIGQLKSVFSFDPDSDGDGLMNWWEEENGLSATVWCDANQLDSDGLSLLQRQSLGLGTSHVVVVQVMDGLQCRGIGEFRMKSGVFGLTSYSATAPHRYTRTHLIHQAYWSDDPAARRLDYWYMEVFDKETGSFNLNGTYDFVDPIYSDSGDIDCDSLMNIPFGIPVTIGWSYYEEQSSSETNTTIYLTGDWTGSKTIQIGDEYTTSQLVAFTKADLSRMETTGWNAVLWSNLQIRSVFAGDTGFYLFAPPQSCDGSGNGNTNQFPFVDWGIVPAALRDLAVDEGEFTLRDLQYRVLITNSTAGVVYRATVFHLFTPEGSSTSAVWLVTNYLAVGTGQALMLTPGDAVTVLSPTNGSDGVVAPVVLKVEFKGQWETSNRVNQVFNPTPKDDPPPTLSNRLYTVECPADSQFHVTLDVDDQPALLRSKLMWAMYDGGTKLAESSFPTSGPANIVFDHPGGSSALDWKDFALRVGYDLNGNTALDSTEEIPISVTNAAGAIIGPPMVKGISTARYDVDWAFMWAGAGFPVIPDTPHAKALLSIFLNGNTSSVGADKQPTQTNTVSFNCYSDPVAVWLTHDAGAPFNSSGTAAIQEYVWGTNTSLADLVCKSYQMKSAAESYYNTNVQIAANAFFATNSVGTITNFPLDGTSYDIPHPDDSLAWVTNSLAGVTVTFEEPWQLDGWDDDIQATINRARLISHTAQYAIEKKTDIFGKDYLKVIRAHYTAVVEDLYDFNAEDTGFGGSAAAVQLGNGNGSYGGGRSSGIIFKDKIEVNQNINNPF